TLQSHVAVVGLASTPTGRGYWEVSSDGGLFAFGDAGFYGSMGGKALNAPVVGIATTPTGRGYWEVGSDGGLFAFGDAGFYGSMGGKPLDQEVTAVAGVPGGRGYWEVGADGGVFAFGDAGFYGSMGGKATEQAVVAVSRTPGGHGYWLVGADGGVFAFGTAQFEGALVDPPPPAPAPAAAIPPAVNPAIATVALSQVGNGDIYGGGGAAWCAFFASWVWEQAGIPIPTTPEASEIGSWALANGGQILPPSATPSPGDAVLFVAPGSPLAWPDATGLNYSTIEHVNIVVQVLPGGGIITVGGNESGTVRELGPYSAANASTWFGQAIYGFVQPPTS
ncbi:MAG: CHAP domain-containing protein, partial [Acidimicrobiales bacterium]